MVGQVSQIATLTAKAITSNSLGSSGGGGGGSSVTAYVPVTLTNSQSSSTSSNFQQMVFFNPSQAGYSADEMANLSNIEFTTGANGAGTVLRAWMESGASKSATNTAVWVNLGGSTVAGSGGTLTIYMNFMSDNSPVTNGYTGYAPQSWCASGCFQTSYAQYDNWASVFTNYWNFAGTTLPSGWIAESSFSSYSVNNGLTITGVAASGYLSTGISLSPPIIIETYGNFPVESLAIPVYNIFLGISANANLFTWQTAGAGGAGYYVQAYASGGNTEFIGTGVNGIFSLVIPTSTTTYGQVNYGTPSTTSTAGNPITYPAALSNPYNSDGQAGTFDAPTTQTWLRTRAYPPSGVMPSFSFGGVA
ncbi:MAG: hypothetical protein M1321_02950 [Candidatus Marsarchaeota archaeon]|nr:hypothetical protein [Candidatus Marsarchaeota archaeon]